jgi:hypothetical protein
LHCTVDVHDAGGKKVLRVLVPRGDDPPYALDDNKIYVRDEAETGLAVRDEIVRLVLRRHQEEEAAQVQTGERREEKARFAESPKADMAPRTGVEVVSVEEREGSHYYAMRDLRNGNLVKNVTRSSARRLWHYAITEFDHLPADLAQSKIQWKGDFGLLRRNKQGNSVRYDLVQRTSQGFRYYFGVTDDGIHGAWKDLVGSEDERDG